MEHFESAEMATAALELWESCMEPHKADESNRFPSALMLLHKTKDVVYANMNMNQLNPAMVQGMTATNDGELPIVSINCICCIRHYSLVCYSTWKCHWVVSPFP